MSGLIRSASLTHYADVARSAGLDPHRMLSEFGLPPGCLKEPDLMVPIDAVRRLLEASAERSGVEAFGLLMAEARRLSNLGPLGLLIREQPTMRLALEALTRYSNRFNEALFLTIEESQRRRRAARGADRRPFGIRAAVDRARDRRGVPDAAHVPRTGLAAATRVLRPRRAGRSLGPRTGIRPPRRVRSRLQRHRVCPRRPRGAQSGRRSRGCAVRAPDARGETRQARRRT